MARGHARCRLYSVYAFALVGAFRGQQKKVSEALAFRFVKGAGNRSLLTEPIYRKRNRTANISQFGEAVDGCYPLASVQRLSLRSLIQGPVSWRYSCI